MFRVIRQRVYKHEVKTVLLPIRFVTYEEAEKFINDEAITGWVIEW